MIESIMCSQVTSSNICIFVSAKQAVGACYGKHVAPSLPFASGMPAALKAVKPAGRPGCMPSIDRGYAPARLWRMSKDENLLGGTAAFFASFLAFSSGVSANLYAQHVVGSAGAHTWLYASAGTPEACLLWQLCMETSNGMETDPAWRKNSLLLAPKQECAIHEQQAGLGTHVMQCCNT